MAGATALQVPQRVTFPAATTVLADLSGQAADGAFTADLSACVEFDSSLFGVLLELRRRAGPAGGDCRFLNPAENLRKLAALYGIDDLLFGNGTAS